jgi:hypothetical protein
VCIPWRPQPDRVDAYKRVRAFWESTGWTITEADSDPDLPFSLCEARNNAVKQAKTDVIVVADADTLPDLGAVWGAVQNPVGVCWPFTKYRHIPGDYHNRADLMSAPIDREYKGSVGGLFVTTQETYWGLGGMDERFEPRWGADDVAFRYVAHTLSTVSRKPGIVFSFNHSADRDMNKATNPNLMRLELYKFCSGKPDLMRELIKR